MFLGQVTHSQRLTANEVRSRDCQNADYPRELECLDDELVNF